MNSRIPHAQIIRSASCLSASVCALAVLASTCVLQAQTIRTWDGGVGGTGTVLNTASNWSGDALPSTFESTARWDGSVAGNLNLTWTGGWTRASGSSSGTNILVTGTQTSALSLTGTGASLNFDTFVVESGAGAVSVGVDAGSFGVVFRGGPSLTNNSSNAVTFGSNVTGWGSGGGEARNVVFGGSGNWEINGNYTNPGGTGIMSLTKDGTGTLTFSGNQNGYASNGHEILSTITINQGTLEFGASAQIANQSSATYGVYTSTITNNGTLEWASSADQTLSGEISGTGTLVQSGAGTLTLTNAHTYTGDTTVSAGTLLVNGSLDSNTIVNGGVLAGTGSLQAIDLEAGAISPGAEGTIGTLDAVSLTLGNTASSFNFNLSVLDNTSDLISLTDAFNGGAGIYTFNFTGGLLDETYTLVTFNSTNFTDVSQFSSTGVAGTFALENSSLTFTAVPEPTTIMMLIGSLAIVLVRRRRKMSV